MVLDRLRSIGKKPDQYAEARMALGGAMMNSEVSRPTMETEMLRDLGINIHTIKSEDLLNLVRSLAVQYYNVPLFDDKGRPMKDESGNQLVQTQVYHHPVFARLLVLIDPLWQTLILSPTQTRSNKLELEYIIESCKLDLSDEEYEKYADLFEAFKVFCVGVNDSAENGKKLKMLKVTPKSFEVNFRSQQNKGKQESFMP